MRTGNNAVGVDANPHAMANAIALTAVLGPDEAVDVAVTRLGCGLDVSALLIKGWDSVLPLRGCEWGAYSRRPDIASWPSRSLTI